MYSIKDISSHLSSACLRGLFLLVLILPGFTMVAQDSFEDIFEGDDQQRTTLAFDWIAHHTEGVDSATAMVNLNHLLDEADNRDDKYVELATRFSIPYYRLSKIQPGSDSWFKEMDEVISEAEQTDKLLWANMLHRAGIVYYLAQKDYTKGLGFLLLAHETFMQLGYEHNMRASTFLYELGRIYYQLGNNHKCIELLVPAQHYSDTSFPYVHLQVLNTLGLAYRNLQRPDSAFWYFSKTLKVAQDKKNAAWIGIASINISKYYISRGEYERALPYAETHYRNSIAPGTHLLGEDSCEALIVLGLIDVHQGQLQQALRRLSNAERGLNGAIPFNQWNRSYDLKRQLYIALGEVHKQLGNEAESFACFMKAYRYKDSLELIRQETRSQKVHTEIAAQQQLLKLKQFNDEKRLSLQARNLSLIVLLLIGILLLILYSRQRLESGKDRSLFESREQLLYTEKLRSEEQLKGYMDLLHEKTKKLEEVQSQLNRFKALPQTTGSQQAIESIENLKSATIITEDDWDQFKELFENVHRGFFTRLKKQFPDITPAEMRLLALIKLNISTKDMAGMLGVSPETIRKTAYRLRKKIPSDMNKDLGEIAGSI
jgi:tetratricopeptide (TPR) repeat protein